jgi:hypothetical protein
MIARVLRASARKLFPIRGTFARRHERRAERSNQSCAASSAIKWIGA